jgi:uncharacterized membrane protein YfcA
MQRRGTCGFAAGGLIGSLGRLPTRALMALLGLVLLISAVKVFQHASKESADVAH